mmetsp:Transcript_21826/g.35796  ORF Transcript_21826/g.35796 Transcript_21826/m.35796 type:complete len:284 (+) Transcript_21826:117-968(+)
MSAAKKIGMRHARGSQMSEILCPTKGYRGALEKKGIKPKNHHRDNLRTLRQKQAQNRMSRAVDEEAERQAVEEQRLRLAKFKGVGSTVAKRLESQPRKGHSFLKKNSRPNPADDAARRGGQINYTSRKTKTKAPIPTRHELDSQPNSARRPNKDWISQNRSTAANTKSRAPPKKRASAYKNFGQVPDYIIERKIQLAQKKEAEVASRKDDLPSGMVQVPEEERLEVLRKLQSGKKEVAAELSRFPLVVETLSRKKAKKALEAKMKEIEDAIKVFSKKKVLIEE